MAVELKFPRALNALVPPAGPAEPPLYQIVELVVTK